MRLQLPSHQDAYWDSHSVALLTGQSLLFSLMNATFDLILKR